MCKGTSKNLDYQENMLFLFLEKPIKTKEHKRKHFVFICFYWFYPVFLDGESK